MSGIVVRRAGPGDGAGFARLFAAVAAERVYVATEPPVDEETVAARVEGRAEADKGHRYFVAEDETGRVVGGLGLHVEGRGVLSLGMMVAAEVRGRGIGGLLMQAAVADARAAGAHRLELGVFTDNASAIALYVRYGFLVEGLQRQRYLRADGTRRDSYLMALLLD